MKKIIFILMFTSLFSCGDNNEITSVKFHELKQRNIDVIEVCFKESFKYGKYHLKYHFTTLDNLTFEVKADLYADENKSCLNQYTSGFSWKGSSKEELENINKIKRDNIKSVLVKLFKNGDLISTSTFYKL